MSKKLNHQHHLIIVGVIVAVTLLLGFGAGAVAAIALLGCAAMIGVVAWFAFDSRSRSADRKADDRGVPTGPT